MLFLGFSVELNRFFFLTKFDTWVCLFFILFISHLLFSDVKYAFNRRNHFRFPSFCRLDRISLIGKPKHAVMRTFIRLYFLLLFVFFLLIPQNLSPYAYKSIFSFFIFLLVISLFLVHFDPFFTFFCFYWKSEHDEVE